MFDIFLTDKAVPETDPGVTAAYGKIQIEEHQETFIASLVRWDSATYYRHWRSALKHLMEANKSVLITSYVAPTESHHLIWWPLFRDGNVVYVQNQMLFYDQLTAAFSVENPWEALRDRQTANAQGQRISEWATNLESVQDCLRRLAGKQGSP